MTNKEALEILTKTDRVGVNLIFVNDEETTKYNQDSKEALTMAIKALEERPQGKWIWFKSGYYRCDKCGEVEQAKKNFCSRCGADMRERR